MNKYLTISASTMLLFAGLFSITGCSSSDDAPVSTTPTPTVPATVPANAVEINAANAEATVAASVATASTFEDGLAAALAVETTPVIGLSGALDLVLPLIRDRVKNSGVDPVTAVEVPYNESGDCLDSGTWSASGSENDAYPTYSDTFNATFVNCDDGLGFIIDGTLAGTVTENYEFPYPYTLAVTGNLSLIVTGDSTVKISFTGIDFQKSGELGGAYTATKSTFAIDFIVNGISSDGFLSKLTADIVSSDGFSCPESGHIFITGANNTNAEGIYKGDTTMEIWANGAIVEPSAVCYY